MSALARTRCPRCLAVLTIVQALPETIANVTIVPDGRSREGRLWRALPEYYAETTCGACDLTFVPFDLTVRAQARTIEL